MTTPERATPDHPAGVWVAFYSDRSGATPFASEVEALRWAVEMHAEVRFVEWGDDIFGAGRR